MFDGVKHASLLRQIVNKVSKTFYNICALKYEEKARGQCYKKITDVSYECS